MCVIAAFGMALSGTAADAATPLAGVNVILNRPPVDSLLRLCITSQTLDPKGTCLGSPPSPAVTGSMSGALAFNELSEAGVGLFFSGLGGPSLGTGFAGFPYFSDAVASIRALDSFPYQTAVGGGTCVTDASGASAALAGINYPRVADPVTPRSAAPYTLPMWGQLECDGTFAGHSGPFNIDFAGTVTFLFPTFDPCCPYANLQGDWAVVFGT